MQLLAVLVCYLANKLQVKMSRSCRFLLFLPHNYQVTLNVPFTAFNFSLKKAFQAQLFRSFLKRNFGKFANRG